MDTTLRSSFENMRIRQLRAASDLSRRLEDADLLAAATSDDGEYVVGFASSSRCVEMALRLRYEIFNLELGEGLDASHLTGLDQDVFDAQMTHLVLLHAPTQEVVGTFRMQTVTHALAGAGIYSGQEFDLAPLAPMFDKAVEVGRVCISQEHRSLANLFLLFKGIRAFLKVHDHQYVFGCCSVTSGDPDDGWRALRSLRRRRVLHPDFLAAARPGYSCGPRERETDPELTGTVTLPGLFTVYTRLGAKIVSEPGLDREFGTIDFIVLLDAMVVDLPGLSMRE